MRKTLGRLKRKIESLFLDSTAKRHSLVGSPKLWKQKREFQIGFLKEQGLSPEHYILDLGCGTLRGGMPIIEYLETGHYFGIDVRPEVLVEARKELADAGMDGKEPTLVTQEQSDSIPGERFDFIWAFSVLIHMDDSALARAMGLVQRCIARDGVFLANVNLGVGEELEWQGFPVVRRPYEFYRDSAAKVGLSVEDLGALKDLGHHSGMPSQDAQHMLRFTRG